jgi:hypothetical protein
MKKRTRLWSAALSLPILAALALPALADHDRGHDRDRDHDRHDHDGDRRERHSFHGRDFGLFTSFELGLWRGGAWRHDWHDGRFGWWWEVDGYWYWYPEPIYPYPTYVPPAAPVVMAPPPPVEMAPPPPAPPTPAAAPAPQFWYYCEGSRGYYPYVATCNEPWRQVPAAAPPGGR